MTVVRQAENSDKEVMTSLSRDDGALGEAAYNALTWIENYPLSGTRDEAGHWMAVADDLRAALAAVPADQPANEQTQMCPCDNTDAVPCDTSHPGCLNYAEQGPPQETCGRFYAHPEPLDYTFCYQQKGHEGECVFKPRASVAADTEGTQR